MYYDARHSQTRSPPTSQYYDYAMYPAHGLSSPPYAYAPSPHYSQHAPHIQEHSSPRRSRSHSRRYDDRGYKSSGYELEKARERDRDDHHRSRSRRRSSSHGRHVPKAYPEYSPERKREAYTKSSVSRSRSRRATINLPYGDYIVPLYLSISVGQPVLRSPGPSQQHSPSLSHSRAASAPSALVEYIRPHRQSLPSASVLHLPSPPVVSAGYGYGYAPRQRRVSFASAPTYIPHGVYGDRHTGTYWR